MLADIRVALSAYYQSHKGPIFMFGAIILVFALVMVCDRGCLSCSKDQGTAAKDAIVQQAQQVAKDAQAKSDQLDKQVTALSQQVNSLQDEITKLELEREDAQNALNNAHSVDAVDNVLRVHNGTR